MGLSVMRLTTGRSNSEWMLQGDKMPAKTKEKWEVKATGFKQSLVLKSCCSGSNNGKTGWQTTRRYVKGSSVKDSVRKRGFNEWNNAEI